MSKGPRFAAIAIKHYIEVLITARSHCYDDETDAIDNDIGLYRSILKILEQDKWPSNS